MSCNWGLACPALYYTASSWRQDPSHILLQSLSNAWCIAIAHHSTSTEVLSLIPSYKWASKIQRGRTSCLRSQRPLMSELDLEARIWAICYHARWPDDPYSQDNWAMSRWKGHSRFQRSKVAILCAFKCIIPSNHANRMWLEKARDWIGAQVFCLCIYHLFQKKSHQITVRLREDGK